MKSFHHVGQTKDLTRAETGRHTLQGMDNCKEWNLQGNRLMSNGYIFTLLKYVNKCSKMIT